MKAKFIYEAFAKKNKETARRDLLFPELREWMEKQDINNYSFDDEGFFNTPDNIHTNLEDLPLNIKLGKVGDFMLWGWEKDTLEGCPKYVEGNFKAMGNNITSFKGAPEYVGGNFELIWGIPNSLEDCPKVVGGDFICHHLIKKFKEKELRAVCDIGGEALIRGENYKRDKEYRETAKAYGGPIPGRATHLVKNVGNPGTHYSRGYKLWHILNFIASRNESNDPPSRGEITKYNYEMNYGKGSFNKYSKLSNEEVKKVMQKTHSYYKDHPPGPEAITAFKHQNSGWGGTNMAPRGYIGLKIKKVTPVEGKRTGYDLNYTGYEYLEDNQHLFGKQEHP
jgi:hypothetical protein